MLLLGCFLAPLKSFAQEPVYWQLTDEDGLPSMTIYDALQDDKGYMWFGTANGICRYDGSKVTVFDHSDFKDQEIIDIEKDAWNRIWMVNLSGQIAYVIDDEVKFLEDVLPIKGKELIKLHVENNSLRILFKGTFSDRSRIFLTYHLSEERPPKLLSNLSSNSNIPLYMVESDQSNCVITIGKNRQEYQINRYDSLFNSSTQYLKIPARYKKWGSVVADFGIYKDQKIFAMARGQEDKVINLFNFLDSTMNLIYTFDKPFNVNSVKVTGNDFWLMSSDGVWTTNLDSMFQDSPKVNQILKGINTNNIVRDREGSYWVLTVSQGLIIIPSLSLKYLRIIHKDTPIEEVYCLLPDPAYDRMLSGHQEGIISVHGTQQMDQIIDINREGEIRDIFRSKDNELYCVTNNGSVVLDSLLKIQYRYSHSASKKLIIDQNDHFWIGTSSGVFFTPQIKDYKHLESNVILDKRTYALHKDSNQRIWIGSFNGLYFYEDSQLKYFETQDSLNCFITDFAETEDGVLWVSTQSEGVFSIKDNRIDQRYTTNDGLFSNDCKKLFWDGQLLWICTNQGLHSLKPDTRVISHLSKKDGLPSNEVNDVAVMNDQVWVATSKGLVHFSKKMVHQNIVPPLIYLSDFKVWDEAYSISTNIELSPNQNNIAFEFIGIALKAKNAVTYKYRIIGIDHSWVYTSTPIARYPVVNPGSYRFEVYSINEDGVESEHPVVVDFTIAVPWLRRWWVISLVLIFLVVNISSYTRQRIKKGSEKRLIQSKIDQLQQKALQTQMNPHFIFNALSAIQKSMTENEQEKAFLYLSRFAKLIRSIFEYSKREEISLEEEIDFLSLYLSLEKLRFRNKINIDLHVDSNLEEHLYSTLFPPLLLQPLVENAFKHGLFHLKGEGFLKIRFSKKVNYLHFSIEDNGIGRKRANKLSEKNKFDASHHSSGISNIKERLRIINSKSGAFEFPTIEIKDIWKENEPAGTRIEVFIYCENFKLKL